MRWSLLAVATAAGCGTDPVPVLADFDDLTLHVLGARSHRVTVLLDTVHDGPPCPMVDATAGGSYGGLPLTVVSTGGEQDGACTQPSFTVNVDAGPLTSSIVELHDQSRSVSASFSAELLADRVVSSAMTQAAPGTVVRLGWSPISDLSSGRVPRVTFQHPLNNGCLPGGEGCFPYSGWGATASIEASELTFIVPAGPPDAIGRGTLSLLWTPGVDATALSCDAAECWFTSRFEDSLPFEVNR